jgi:hypothetical protein
MKMRKQMRLRLPLFVLLCLSTVSPLASEDAPETHAEQADHPHRHHVALFVGASNNDHEIDLSLGAEYELRFRRIVGGGVLIDRAGGRAGSTVVGVGVWIHPVGDFKFLLAPGLEFRNDSTEFLVRVGAAYDFHIKSFSISPTFNVDFVDSEEILVYGVHLGYGF